MPISRFVLIVCLAATLLASCTPANLNCKSGEQYAITDSVYFGTAKPVGTVTPAEWAEFLNSTVTPRFPNGLTVSQASGQWRNADGVAVREATYILILVHPDDTFSDTAIQEIIVRFKQRFDQESVLRVKSQSCAVF